MLLQAKPGSFLSDDDHLTAYQSGLRPEVSLHGSGNVSPCVKYKSVVTCCQT